MNAEQYAKQVVAAASKKTWVNGTDLVNDRPIGIKAYGLWVQRITFNGISDGGEFKSQKAMREFIVSFINRVG